MCSKSADLARCWEISKQLVASSTRHLFCWCCLSASMTVCVTQIACDDHAVVVAGTLASVQRSHNSGLVDLLPFGSHVLLRANRSVDPGVDHGHAIDLASSQIHSIRVVMYQSGHNRTSTALCIYPLRSTAITFDSVTDDCPQYQCHDRKVSTFAEVQLLTVCKAVCQQDC